MDAIIVALSLAAHLLGYDLIPAEPIYDSEAYYLGYEEGYVAAVCGYSSLPEEPTCE